MDPAEEIRHTKKQKDNYDMLGFVADSDFGIRRRCGCGGRIIHEVGGKEDYDTVPGKCFFTCVNYEDDGLHYRHPWVIAVQEEIERLRKRLDEAEEMIKGVWSHCKQLETLEEQVRTISVEVAALQKVCYD